MNKLEELKYRAQSFGLAARLEDTLYLLSIIEQQNEILKSLAYTVLSDFTTMSEYHTKSTIVELAKKAEILCEMDIKTRATDEAINEYWELEG